MTSDRDKVDEFLEDVEDDIRERRTMTRWADTVLAGLRDYASTLSYVAEPKRRGER